MANSIDGVWGLRNNSSPETRQPAKGRGGAAQGLAEQGLPAAQGGLVLTDTARSLQEVERRLSQAPDVDEAKVERIRAAIANGTYQVNAGRGAAKFLAMEAERQG